MARQDLTLSSFEVSSPITVTPLAPVGIETDLPIKVRGENNSVIWYSKRSEEYRSAIIIPPNETIVIEAGEEGASVIVVTSDE